MATINRVNGIVSGFDTETMVKSLMKFEQAKVDKKYQEKQLLTWQKDSYKEFSSLLRGLQSEFFDVIKPASNLRGSTMFNVFSAGVTTGTGAASTDVTATTTSGSVKGTITLSQITQLASRDTWNSSEGVKSLTSTTEISEAMLSSISAGEKISVTVDGNTKEISLAGGYGTDLEALRLDLQTKLGTAFGAGKVSVAAAGNKLTLDSLGSVVTLSDGETGALGKMGFVAGATNALNLSSTLASAFGSTDPVSFSINGVTSETMGIKSTDTIKQMIDKVNASAAGVTMSYSTISDKFTMQATKEGVVSNIDLQDGAGFFSTNLKITNNVTDRVQGQDAILTINGVATSRSSNTFQVDGTNITLKAKPADGTTINIGITSNPGTAVETIKSFVAKYNELIDKISLKTTEKKYRDYVPLTDEQKKAMTDDDVKLWEEKAKSGLLRSDPTLQNLSDKLRAAVFAPVEGLGISLKDIGITTSSYYADNGKLVLDESKLKTALTERPNEVIQLFTNESDTAYADMENRTTRNSQNGWANRINDILQDNIRLTRDSNNQRGLLIEKAGYEKDGSESTSVLAKKIKTTDTAIATLLERMADKEELYYAQFTRMESALSKMNSQFASTFGSTGSSS